MSTDKTQINFREYWGIMVRRKALLILPLVIVPLAAFAFTYFMNPSYVSSVGIMLSEAQVLPPTVEREMGRSEYGYPWSGSDRQSSLYNQITSTKYLRRLIAVLNLPITGGIREKVSAIKAAFPEIAENELAENILADDMRTNITVNLRTSNIMDIRFKASDPISAQKHAKALADIFIEENLAQELAGVRSNISFSEEQLAFYREKLKEAEDRLRDFRQQLLTTSVGEDTSSTNLQQIASAVEALDLEISKQDEGMSELRTQLAAQNVDVIQLSLPKEILNQKGKLISTISRMSDLLSNYSWRDPKVLGLNEDARLQLDNINRNLKSDVEQRFADKPADLRARILQYLVGSVSLEFNGAKQATLNRSIGRIKSRLGQDPATDITMQRLQSEVDNYKKFYDLFVSHSQNAAIDQSAKKVEAEARYTIIQPASLPLSPESPQRMRILIIGILLGFAFGFGAIVLVELLDTSFKKVEDLAAYAHLPVLGTVPRINLPYASSARKKIPIIIGAGIGFLLVLLIVFLNLRKIG